jgi:hypothetical protein
LISLLEVTDELKMTSEPIAAAAPESSWVAVNLQLVTLWTRTDRDVPERFFSGATILAPNGEEFQGDPLEGNLEGTNRRTRLIAHVDVIPFRGTGTYWFNVWVAGDGGTQTIVARIPLEVSGPATPLASISPEPHSEHSPAAPEESSSRPAPSRPSGRQASPKRQRRG